MPRSETARPGKRPLRSLSAQEKMNAIKRVHEGESKAAVARDIGVPESTLRGWCKSEQKILNQVNSLAGITEQSRAGLVSSPSVDSNGSTPRSTPPNSNLPANGAHMIASTSSMSAVSDPSNNAEADTIAQVAKRARLENGMTTGSSAHASYSDEINGRVPSHNMYGYESDLSPNQMMLLLQQFKVFNQNCLMSVLNAGNVANVAAAAVAAAAASNTTTTTTTITTSSSSSSSSSTGGASTSMSAVNLIENGLQYIRTNGTTNSRTNNRRKNRSPVQIERSSQQQLVETPRSSSSTSRNQMIESMPTLMLSLGFPPAIIASLINEQAQQQPTTTAAAAAIVTAAAAGVAAERNERLNNRSIRSRTNGTFMHQIAMNLSLNHHIKQLLDYQEQQRLRSDQTSISIKLLIEWFTLYASVCRQIIETPNLRRFMSHLVMTNGYSNNNNNEEEDNDISVFGLNMAIRNGITLIHWMEHYGSERFTEEQVGQVRDIVNRMREWANQIRNNRILNSTS